MQVEVVNVMYRNWGSTSGDSRMQQIPYFTSLLLPHYVTVRQFSAFFLIEGSRDILAIGRLAIY